MTAEIKDSEEKFWNVQIIDKTTKETVVKRIGFEEPDKYSLFLKKTTDNVENMLKNPISVPKFDSRGRLRKKQDITYHREKLKHDYRSLLDTLKGNNNRTITLVEENGEILEINVEKK